MHWRDARLHGLSRILLQSATFLALIVCIGGCATHLEWPPGGYERREPFPSLVRERFDGASTVVLGGPEDVEALQTLAVKQLEITGRRGARIEQIRWVNPSVAIIDTWWTESPDGFGAHQHYLQVFEKHGSRWRFIEVYWLGTMHADPPENPRRRR